jgi:preprotein translocase subunit SecA
MLLRQSEPEINAKFPGDSDEARAARKAEIERIATGIRAGVERDREIVLKAGGLYVVGTERHESRRIDNQLRGRSGRQGDPGRSRFFLSLEDDLMRIFGSDKLDGMLRKLGLKENEAIVHPWINKALEKAQQKVEARNFDIRKQLLEYDDVANDQRKTIYALRNELLESQDVSPRLADLRAGVITDLFRTFVPEESVEEQWDVKGLEGVLKAELNLSLPIGKWLEQEPELGDDALLERISQQAHAAYRAKIPPGAEDSFHQYERYMMLQILDSHWREHLAALDHLRQGIHLRGYAQKNPKQEYKREAFELFGGMLEGLKLEVTRTLVAVEIRASDEVPKADVEQHVENVRLQHADYDTALADGAEEKKPQPTVRPTQKVGRNDPCPCGSGRKYKHCHGKLS